MTSTAGQTRFTFQARDGRDIVAYRWMPSGPPRGLVQLTHGMGEHVLRYDAVARALTGAGFLVERDEGTGDAEAQRTGLAAHATTVERGVDVVDVGRLREAQRLERHHPVGEDREVLLERPTVDLDDAGAGPEPHAGHRFFTATGALDERIRQGVLLLTVD